MVGARSRGNLADSREASLAERGRAKLLAVAHRPRSPRKGSPDAKLDELVTLAQIVLSEHAGVHASAEIGRAALELSQKLAGNLAQLGRVLERLGGHTLLDRLLDLPLALSTVHETELALSLTEALLFLAPDKLSGDAAVILAHAGRREEALARVEKNLAHASDAVIAEAKAGDVYRALGEHDAAEAYYRRSLVEAKNPMERAEAVLRITSLLIDSGREADARAFVEEQRAHTAK